MRIDQINEKMVDIEGGVFGMGNDNDDDIIANLDVKPLHNVQISKFEISKYEITNQQYCDFLNSGNHSYEKVKEWIVIERKDVEIKKRNDRYSIPEETKKNHPVVCITWYGAVSYCNFLSSYFGYKECYSLSNSNWKCDFSANGFRLPTEAEWEYACKCGASGEQYEELDKIAWYEYNSNKEPHEVGKKDPNKFKLYDMLGNVSEWCNDWYGERYYRTLKDKNRIAVNPEGPDSGSSVYPSRVYRGGGWDENALGIYSTSRHSAHPGSRWGIALGFRVARGHKAK